MVKDAFEGKSLLAVGAAVAFCGAALYATGQVLDLLFRDVDPKRKAELQEEERQTDEPEAIEAEAATTDPA